MSSKSILVVDDERLLGDLLKSSLESEELTVQVVGSADEARRRVSERRPDLLLLDLSIPGRRELLESLCPNRMNCPVVALVDSDATRRTARRSGLEVLDKKDGLSELIHLLRTRLDLRSLPSPGGDNRILIVDDDDSARELLGEFLRDNDYGVEEADDGVAALERVNEDSSIAVVLLDIMLPRLGGIEVLAKLKERENSPDSIMITAISDEQIAHEAIRLGAFDYLVKPLDLQRVESVISACFSHRQYRKDRRFWNWLTG